MSAQLNTTKVLYTAKVRTVGNRDGGVSRSDDGRVDLTYTAPGKPGTGTNPEQLLAAGWSACFQGALGLAAGKAKMTLPATTLVDTEVALCFGDDGYSLQARLRVSLPGLPREVALSLIDAAQQTCPYSKALHSIPVTYTLA